LNSAHYYFPANEEFVAIKEALEVSSLALISPPLGDKNHSAVQPFLKLTDRRRFTLGASSVP
jgi:hypothetical protein